MTRRDGHDRSTAGAAQTPAPPVRLASGAHPDRARDGHPAAVDGADEHLDVGRDPALPTRPPVVVPLGELHAGVDRFAVRPVAAQQHDRVGDVRDQNLVLCSLAGYAFARLRIPGGRLAFVAILATLMVPFQVVMIPTLLIIKNLGLVDTLPALMAPNLVTPFGIYLLRQFFLSLPVELEEAALIDGAGRFRILGSILLPLMGPPLSTVAVLTFLSVWNDFLWPLVATSSPDTMTVQLGLATFQSAHFTNWPVLMAGTLLSQLPVLALFVAAQRFFVSSIASTGIK